MTNSLDLLADRVERASGIAAELGCLHRDIALALGWHRVEPRFYRNKYGAWIAPDDFRGTYGSGAPILDSLHGTEMHRKPPLWLWSLEAAMSLKPKGAGVAYTLSEGPWVSANVRMWEIGTDGTVLWEVDADAATPAQAFTAACLRAL